MAAVPATTTQKDDPVSDSARPQDSTTHELKSDESLYKVPENYFFHNKTHIEEGDVVIVFMVSISPSATQSSRS